MARLFTSILVLSLPSIAMSTPLHATSSNGLKVDRYNPMRRVMDALCMGFETSFCRGNTSPATAHHIIPEASTTKTTRVIPNICEPSNFMDYRNFVDNRPFDIQSEISASKQGCCLACHDAGNCLSWVFNPTSMQCNFYTATTRAEDGGESDVCPLGVDRASYEEMPGYPMMLGSSFGHNYGPCLGNAPLRKQEAYARSDIREPSTGQERGSLRTSSLTQQVNELR